MIGKIMEILVKAPVAISAIFFTAMAIYGLHSGDMFQALFGTVIAVVCWRFVL